MAIVETIEKRELHIVLGAHEAPASYRWKAMRFLRNSDDGSDAAPPTQVMVPCSKEEVDKHFGKALAKQLEDIAADSERYSALCKEHDALQRAHNQAVAKLDAVRQALSA